MNQKAPDDHDPFNTKRPEVYDLKGLQWLLFYPAAWGLWLYYRSFRWRMDEETKRQLAALPAPRLIAVWHNRSLVAAEWLRMTFDPPRFACLISPSRMAAWEVAFFRFLKLKVIRGSSTRRSVQAAIEILRALREGNDAGISPDGPSGPLYSFQEGAITLARKAGASMVVLSLNAGAAYRARTWDRHLIPIPFARVDVLVRIIEPDDPIWEKPDAEVAAEVRSILLEMTRDPFSQMDN